MQLDPPQKQLKCLPETRAGSPRTDLTCSSHQLNFVTTILSVTGLRCSPSQMALLPPQMPTAQAAVTPPSPFYLSSQPETTSSSTEQQICLLSQRAHTGSDHITSPTVSPSQRTSSSSLVQLVMLLFKM